MGLELLFLLIPAIFSFGLIGFATISVAERSNLASRWAATGFGFALLSAVVEAMRMRWSPDVVAFSLPFHLAAIASFMQAFMVRRNVRNNAAFIFMLILSGAVANVIVSRVHYWPDARIILVNGLAVVIIAHCLFRLRNARDPLLEKIILAFVGVVGAIYAARLALFVGAGHDGDYGNLATWSQYKVVAYVSASLLAMCTALILGVAIGSDIVRAHDAKRGEDSLTGIANRYAYDAWLNADEVTTLSPYAGALMIDIDRFKLINDTMGHESGDVALREVALTLQEVLSRYGDLARIGGEEFAVLVKSESPLSPGILAEAARAAVSALILPPPCSSLKVTVSIGYATREPDQSITHTIRRADMALYQAKMAGRNRSVSASALDPTRILRAA